MLNKHSSFQVEKIQSKERMSQQKLSEYRTKISSLEGENKSMKETTEQQRVSIKQLNEKLAKSEVSRINIHNIKVT